MFSKRRFGCALNAVALLASLTSLTSIIPACAQAPAVPAFPVYAGPGKVNLKQSKIDKPTTREDDPAIAMITEALAKSNAGDNQAAIEIATRAIAKYPNSAVAYGYRGLFYYSLNKCSEALADENKALSLAPNYVVALKTRAAIHIFGSPQDLQAAITDLNKAMSVDCSDAVLWYFRGYSRYVTNNYVDALPDLCVANDLNGGWFFSHYYRGLTLAFLNIYEVAELDAQQIVKMEPKNGSGLWLLGYVYEHTNRKSAAAEQYQKALDIFTAANDTSNVEIMKAALKRVQS